jgi:dTDP-4-amino-4,6-dideoxygalactose transaminase/nucleoside-diphosphate-sugar epimerase
MGGPVLVTGGAGFIGSAVAAELLRRGREVVCLDVQRGERLAGGAAGARFVEADVTDAAMVEAEVARAGLVIHLAAVVGVEEYLRRPERVLDVNILGSRNVMHACAQHGRPVLLASSSEVYGKNPFALREESDEVLGAPSRRRWSYAVSKAAAEHYAHALGDRGLAFAIVRYFNVYGALLDQPGEGRVLARFLGCLRDRRPLPLVDGGGAVRCFCYVDDAVEATVALALALEVGDAVRARTFNVGRHEPVTMRRLAETLLRLSGRPLGTVDVPSGDLFGDGFEEIPQRVPDVSALREAIGFEARVPLDEGLRRLLAHWGLLAAAPAPEARPLVPLVRPWFEPDAELLEAYRAALESGRVSNHGPQVRRFEEEAAAWLGVEQAVAVANGADGLLLAVKALGLSSGKVVLPAFTYIATLAAFVENGLEPIFCDVDPARWTLDPDALGEVLERERGVAAVAPVNVYGVPPDLARIAALAEAAGAALIYDNAHGVGTEQGGRRAPVEPRVQMLSLHATKVLPAIEGGLVLSPDARLLEELRRLRNHGLVTTNVHTSSPGYNAKLDELRAATGRHSLRRLDAALARRRGYAARLRAFLEGCGGAYQVQRVPDGVTSNFQNLAVLCRAAERVGLEAVIGEWQRHGVEARRYFYPPLHELQRYRGRFALPVTERVCAGLICLPMHARMEEIELRTVEEAAARAAEAFSP